MREREREREITLREMVFWGIVIYIDYTVKIITIFSVVLCIVVKIF